jgi:hypothetical protein
VSTGDQDHLHWRKSQRSGGPNTACVEVADEHDGDVFVRDSKDPQGPVLRFDRETWRVFVADVKADRFDRPASDPDRGWMVQRTRPSSAEPTVQ